MEFRDYFVWAMVTGLFVLLIVSFVSNFQTQNNADININQNPFLNRFVTNVSNELNSSADNAEAQRQAYATETSNPILTSLGFAFTSILNAGNTFISSVVNIFGALFFFIGSFFSINPIVTGTILAIIIGTILLAVWSLIRAGR